MSVPHRRPVPTGSRLVLVSPCLSVPPRSGSFALLGPSRLCCWQGHQSAQSPLASNRIPAPGLGVLRAPKCTCPSPHSPWRPEDLTPALSEGLGHTMPRHESYPGFGDGSGPSQDAGQSPRTFFTDRLSWARLYYYWEGRRSFPYRYSLYGLYWGYTLPQSEGTEM